MAWEYLVVVVVGLCAVILISVVTVILCWIIVFKKHKQVLEKRQKRLVSGSTPSSEVSYPTLSKTSLPATELSLAKTFNKNAFSTLTTSERFDYMLKSENKISLKANKTSTIPTISSFA